jgi:hypothetical protein
MCAFGAIERNRRTHASRTHARESEACGKADERRNQEDP